MGRAEADGSDVRATTRAARGIAAAQQEAPAAQRVGTGLVAR
jgi:hypothetical protein